ncbi:MAG: hypothetical protein QM534_18830 [Sediminibacterium sp.]|nr:hypothetical protein [Sediminibacterium sp.]
MNSAEKIIPCPDAIKPYIRYPAADRFVLIFFGTIMALVILGWIPFFMDPINFYKPKLLILYLLATAAFGSIWYLLFRNYKKYRQDLKTGTILYYTGQIIRKEHKLVRSGKSSTWVYLLHSDTKSIPVSKTFYAQIEQNDYIEWYQLPVSKITVHYSKTHPPEPVGYRVRN